MLSTVATILELGAVLAATSRSVLVLLSVPLISAGAIACICGTLFTIRGMRDDSQSAMPPGSAFSLKTALIFAATFTTVLFSSAALDYWLGILGVMVASALAGFADPHSAASSVATFVSAGKLNAVDAIIPCLAGLTTNTISKAVFAITSGGRSFALQVVPGLVLVIASAWIAAGWLYL